MWWFCVGVSITRYLGISILVGICIFIKLLDRMLSVERNWAKEGRFTNAQIMSVEKEFFFFRKKKTLIICKIRNIYKCIYMRQGNFK